MRSFFIAIALLVPAASHAFGNDDTWSSGFGQGVKEAVITKGPGNQIYVSCGQPIMDRSPTAIRFSLMGDSPDTGEVLLTFDGDMPRSYQLSDGEIGSNSRAGDSQFTTIIGLLKAKSKVNVRFSNGLDATFSLQGSSKAIGDCPSDFSQ